MQNTHIVCIARHRKQEKGNVKASELVFAHSENRLRPKKKPRLISERKVQVPGNIMLEQP